MDGEVAKTLELYPDLAERGGFAPAFQLELERVGSSLKIGKPDALPIAWPHLVHGDRSCQALLAAKHRSFAVSCWHRGVHYGGGWTPELGQLARLFCDFLEHRASLKQLEANFPWFAGKEEAFHHEAGPSAYVENQWKWFESHPTPAEPDLHRLICEAGKHKKLRQLLPFTSLVALRFSRTTGYPFASKQCPYAYACGDDVFRVVAPSRGNPASNESERIIGEGDAIQAAAWLAEAVPDIFGAAIDGTEADLAEAGRS